MYFLTSIRPPQVHAAKRPCRRLPRLLYVLSPEALEVLGIIDVDRIDCYADPCRSDIDAMMSFRDVRSMSWHRGGFLGFNLPVRVSVQNGLLLKSPLHISQASARNKKTHQSGDEKAVAGTYTPWHLPSCIHISRLCI